MTRLVEPELLDELPAQAPDAQRSRSDLIRLNTLMGHARLIRRSLQQLPTACSAGFSLSEDRSKFGTQGNRLKPALQTHLRRVIDLGAGDGTLLASALKGVSGIQEVVLVDRQTIVSDSTVTALRSRAHKVTVLEADAFAWLRASTRHEGNAIVANLFLHHFQGTQLAELLRLVAERCDLFIACEPRRGAWPGFAASLLGLIGCNRVTRHDARISVRAGFRDRELSAIWPDPGLWQIEEREAGLFSHLFVARRSA